MVKKNRPVICYISSVINSNIDSALEQNGFSHGLIIFAIPDYGILFRCRAEGDRIALEFGAFFSLLRFLKTYLEKEKIGSVVIRSSYPEFVFSFAGHGRHLAKGSERELLLREYTKGMSVSVEYSVPFKNRCLLSPADYPSVPVAQRPVLKPDWNDRKKNSIKPFQRGIKL